MKSAMSIKEKFQDIYAHHSRILDIVFRFVLAFITFYTISENLGYMKSLTNPIITAGLSVVCAFLPTTFTALAGAAVILGHIFKLSLGMLIIVALIFFLMFIMYVRFAPKTAIAVLLMPIAFMLKIPSMLVVSLALIFSPVYAVPAALGTGAYYTICSVKEMAGSLSDEEGGFLTEMMDTVKGIFQNPEMWMMAIAAILAMLVVYAIRRMAMQHAWKIASVAGAAVYFVVAVAGGSVFGYKVNVTTLMISSVAAIVAGLILELLFFAVDYKKCETLQYEDDRYYYYVKAVPKVGVTPEKKPAKKEEDDFEEGSEEVAVKAEKPVPKKRKKKVAPSPDGKKPVRKKRPEGAPARKPGSAPKKRPVKKQPEFDDTDQLLFTQSIKNDLNLDDNLNEKN